MKRFFRIGSDTPDYTADDITGKGASITGGRWNRKGTVAVYAASSISLSILETIAHFNLGDLPLNRYLVELSIDAALLKRATRFAAKKLPIGWDAIPAGMVSQDLGEQWLKACNTALLFVPSAIVEEEFNILVNPAHPDAGTILVRKVRRLNYQLAVRPAMKS